MRNRPVRLYDLLPRYVRFRDQRTEGRSLEVLVDTLQIPFDELRENIALLYDSYFVETCPPWFVPYIGDLVAVRGLSDPRENIWSQRAQVANTLAYRRRRGTLAVLEGAVRNCVGCPAVVVDGADLLAATQSLDDPRPEALGTVDLRRLDPIDDLELSSALPRIADPSGRSHCLPRQVAVRLFPHHAVPIRQASAREIANGEEPGDGRRFTVDPFGISVPLYQHPATPRGTVFRHRRRHLPIPLGRGYARERLAAGRDHLGESSLEELLSLRLEVFVGPPSLVGGRVVLPEEVWITDLSRWRLPELDAWPVVVVPDRHGPVERPRVALDPGLGRFAFRDALPGRQVRVDACRASDGGPGAPALAPEAHSVGDTPGAEGDVFVAHVHRGADPGLPETLVSLEDPGCGSRGEELFLLLLVLVASSGREEDPAFLPTLGEALRKYRLRRRIVRDAGRGSLQGVIRVLDSGTYTLGGDSEDFEIELDGDSLRVEAAPGTEPFLLGRLRARGPSPDAVLRAEGADRGRLDLVGLRLDGPLDLGGALEVFLDRSIVRPPLDTESRGPAILEGEKSVPEKETDLDFAFGPPAEPDRSAARFGVRSRLVAHASLVGPIELDEGWAVMLSESIVDAGGDGSAEAIGPDPVLDATATTVLGRVRAKHLSALDSLFTGRVEARDRSGRVDACYVPRGSRVGPKRGFEGPGLGRAPSEPGDVVPVFASRRYGDPDYARLALSTSSPLLEGTDDGGELGAARGLYRASRRRNLQPIFDEYVPWDHSARISDPRSTSGVWRRRSCEPRDAEEDS